MMMNMYKKVSTLLTIMCVLYMCLISVLHLSFQARSRRSRAQEEPSLISSKGQDFIQVDKQNWTRQGESIQGNQSITQEKLLPSNFSEPHLDAGDHKSSPEDSVTSSLKIWRHLNIPKENVTLRTPGEGIQEQANAHSQEHTSHQVNRILTDNTTSKVSQYKVDFLPLGTTVYVYGAFLDTRYSDGQYVRILILQPTLHQTRQFLCQFSSNQNRRVNVMAEVYEMCENHGKRYGGWIYSCKIPETAGDLSLTILLPITGNRVVLDSFLSLPRQSLNSGHLHKTTNSLDIQHKQHKMMSSANTEHEEIHTKFEQQNRLHLHNNMRIGVCVPPLFGDVCLSKIINFIEMCRLLGADKVFLYIHDIPKEILAFLQNYTGGSPSILTLVLWDLPVLPKKTWSLEANQIIWNHGQLLAVQHCMYTNMPNLDWLLFMDIDEMLVPRTSQTWPQILSQVLTQFHSQSQGRSVAGISFESAFFQQDFHTQVTNSIHYFQHLHRTRMTSARRSKLFVQPFQVFEMGIHHVSKTVSEEMDVVRAGTSQALLHHYRKCVSDDVPDRELQCEILVKDETILKYEAPLTIASREVTSSAMEFLAHIR